MMRIRNFIHPFAKYYSHIQFTVQGEAPDNVKFNYTKALHFVRIVQEAVSNSIKHASPSLINIVTDHEQDRWILKITDNGKGFNCASRKEAERGNGLTNMEHRAAEAGFELKIESKDREGTTITVIT
jgi:signal transduction histidine kinase